MKNSLQVPLVILVSIFCAVAQTPNISDPPATPRHPVIDEYFGVKVSEDYRWLENWDDPAVKQWSSAQDARTRAYLEHLPSYAAIHARLAQLKGSGSVSYNGLQFRAGMLFANQTLPGHEQPLLVALRSADDPGSAKVIFDPNALSARGAIAVSFFVPSFDGKYVAAVLSKDESEDGAAHVYEVATSKELPDFVPRVNFATAGGSIAWKGDNSGFYYTRYPQGNERPPEDANFYQQVYFHKLGTDSKQDTYIIGKDFPRIAEIELHTSDDGRWLLASVANGDGGQFAHYLMGLDGHWTQITHFEDGIVSVKFGLDSDRGVGGDTLYLLSHKDAARGQILQLSLAQPDLTQAKVVVAQVAGGSEETDRASIEDFVSTVGHLYVIDNVGGPSRVRVFDSKGQALPAPPLPPIARVDEITPIGNGDVLFSVETYIDPPAWYRYSVASGKTTRTAMFETAPFNFDDAEVTREFATSKDGTRVPINIIRLKTMKLDGNNPVLLMADTG
jgi:prolyl oligopeptidase